jgi:signal transduction histidine kinase
MKRRNSLRWRLPLTYASIALLTALALGGVLLLMLRGYYRGLERDYLMRNATVTASIVGESIHRGVPLPALQAQIESLAFFARARIRLTDPHGNTILDSGSMPDDQRFEVRVEEQFQGGAAVKIDTGGPRYFWSIVAAPPGESVSAPVPPGGGGSGLPVGIASEETDVMMVLPVTGTMYGFDLRGDETFTGARSTLSVTSMIMTPGGSTLGFVQLNEGPAYGREILASVAWGVTIAGATAVLLAALAGFVISRQISAPLLELAQSTRSMADGDLSVRVALDRPDEIGVLAASFNEMADQIQEMVVTLRRLVTDAAHELHTPLTALRTNLEMAADEPDPHQQAQYLEHALAQLQRFEALTSNLLLLSRLEAGAVSEERESINLTVLLHEAVEVYASRAEQAGLSFRAILPDGEKLIRGHEGQIQRALANLLDNALKFTPAGGEVTIILSGSDDEIEIRIEDTGIGIPDADVQHLFERFHRGRNAAGYPGSGLGLAITRAIINSHEGSISVEHQESGARFVAKLPGLKDDTSHNPELSD